jgi:hypothetical protein
MYLNQIELLVTTYFNHSNKIIIIICMVLEILCLSIFNSLCFTLWDDQCNWVSDVNGYGLGHRGSILVKG